MEKGEDTWQDPNSQRKVWTGYFSLHTEKLNLLFDKTQCGQYFSSTTLCSFLIKIHSSSPASFYKADIIQDQKNHVSTSRLQSSLSSTSYSKIT